MKNINKIRVFFPGGASQLIEQKLKSYKINDFYIKGNEEDFIKDIGKNEEILLISRLDLLKYETFIQKTLKLQKNPWIHILDNYIENEAFIRSCYDNKILLTSARCMSKKSITEHILHSIFFFIKKSQEYIYLIRNQSLGHIISHGLDEKVIGIIGYDASLLDFIDLMKNSFKCTIILFEEKTFITEMAEKLKIFHEINELEKLMPQLNIIDVLINCLPKVLPFKEKKLITTKNFLEMKPLSIFINLGNTGNFDSFALIEALTQTKLLGAWLDIPLSAIPKRNHPFYNTKNLMMSVEAIENKALSLDRGIMHFNENYKFFNTGNLDKMTGVINCKYNRYME